MDYNDIVNSSHDVLVEFYASWCPHCQHMMPIVAQIKELLSDHLDVVQFDIDDYSRFASEAGGEQRAHFHPLSGWQGDMAPDRRNDRRGSSYLHAGEAAGHR